MHTVFFVLLLASATSFAQSPGQDGSKENAPSTPETTASSTANPVAPPVAEAEAAIVKSDWKTAEAKLDTWLAAHPSDGRALFDAGYVADAQNRLDDAVNLYRRATVADPNSFEAHLSLGLLLARQNNLADARPELEAATNLDPGEAGPALKARAWRALAEIDKPGPATVRRSNAGFKRSAGGSETLAGDPSRYPSGSQPGRIGRAGPSRGSRVPTIVGERSQVCTGKRRARPPADEAREIP